MSEPRWLQFLSEKRQEELRAPHVGEGYDKWIGPEHECVQPINELLARIIELLVQLNESSTRT
jgi:hypothetical protein